MIEGPQSPERHIVFIVNGEDIALTLPRDLPLGKTKEQALIESQNTGRRFEDWDVRDMTGFLLNDSTPVAELEVVWGEAPNPHRGADSPLPTLPSARLFLTLRVGAGGGGTLPGGGAT